MLMNTRHGLLALALLATAGCATQGSWMGADAEKQYDKELEAKRLAEAQNNDDYYEIRKDGRIYVLADAKSYEVFVQTGEIPLVVTRIGAGPKGETLKLALTKNEAKAMEGKVGFTGGAQNLFEGKVQGLEKGFFGFVGDERSYVVFDNWKQLDAYRKNGTIPAGATTEQGKGPNGTTVVYATRSDELIARFKKLNGLQ